MQISIMQMNEKRNMQNFGNMTYDLQKMVISVTELMKIIVAKIFWCGPKSKTVLQRKCFPNDKVRFLERINGI